MAMNDIPLLSMLKSRLGYLSQQQRATAVNVANSDTPGFIPSGLKPFSYTAPGKSVMPAGTLSLAPVQTSAAHLAGRSTQGGNPVWKTQLAPDSEARLDGNQVVLEEQMLKMNEARSDYDTAISFYQKSLSMLQLAIKKPGG